MCSRIVGTFPTSRICAELSSKCWRKPCRERTRTSIRAQQHPQRRCSSINACRPPGLRMGRQIKPVVTEKETMHVLPSPIVCFKINAIRTDPNGLIGDEKITCRAMKCRVLKVSAPEITPRSKNSDTPTENAFHGFNLEWIHMTSPKKYGASVILMNSTSSHFYHLQCVFSGPQWRRTWFPLEPQRGVGQPLWDFLAALVAQDVWGSANKAWNQSCRANGGYEIKRKFYKQSQDRA